MAGSNDLWAWLQSIMQNQGANQPYGPGTPTGGAGPQSLMPGGGVMGRGAATSGGPSMGYPALSQMFGISPAQAGEAQPGGLFPPEAIAAANRGGTPTIMGPKFGQSVFRAGDIDASVVPPMPQPAPPGTPSATPRPAGSQAPPFNWPASATPTGMPAPPTGPLASPDATAATPMKRKAGAANLGYYQPNDRFVPIDRPNAPAGGGGGMARGGPPQMTALNLAGLFNRGQQPGVNPNVPAAAAQPVSAPSGQGPIPSGPFANAPMPPVMPPDIQNQRVRNAVSSPNWWQNL